MGRLSNSSPVPSGSVALRIPRKEAEIKIQKQINEGETLLSAEPPDQNALNALKEKRRIWSDYNRDLLQSIFTTDDIAKEYSEFVGGSFRMQPSFMDLVGYYKADVQSSLTRLRSILRRLELFSAPDGSPASVPVLTGAKASKEIFLVHGHNNEVKETVARFLEHLGLSVTILHEAPDKGRTIIEKFVDHASVRYAVVLLTSDDLGASRGTPSLSLKPRARQNVILELGYFLGTLGRTHVCALREEGVEVPSDLSGVLYVPLDTAGGWKLKLASEIKAAGIDVDLNRVICGG